jgi:hypothetical protein
MTARDDRGTDRRTLLRAGLGLALGAPLGGSLLGAAGAARAAGEDLDTPETFRPGEIVESGHRFFGTVSRGLALTVEEAGRRWGEPNGYILGQEGGGAFIAGLTYGEGQLNTKNAGEHPLYWQGPSLGLDYGGQGSRVMMLVYDLPSIDSIYARFGGVSGSAYVIAGFGMTLLKNNNVLVVPIRTGVGARLGINVGYLKVTPNPTWNPF